jgi:hypothetical protein
MQSVFPILLIGLAGIFVGGALSLRRQGAGLPAVIGAGVIAALAGVGGVLWLVSE